MAEPKTETFRDHAMQRTLQHKPFVTEQELESLITNGDPALALLAILLKRSREREQLYLKQLGETTPTINYGELMACPKQ